MSVGLGSCSEDVDRLVDAVRTLVAGRRNWTYAKESGQWNPVPETRFSRDALV